MTTLIVTTQTELDAALTESRQHPDDHYQIIIQSPHGARLSVSDTGNSTVEAFGSSTVEAFGSSTVRASNSSTVEAFGSSTVEAFESSTVRAFDSSTVRASGSSTVRAFESSTVEAFGSSTVKAYDSSTVRAFGNSTVRAFASSTVRAFDSSTVRASGSSTVEASGSSTVEASGSSTVRAGSHTAVHLHSGCCAVTGGVRIDHTTVNFADTAAWAGYHGCQINGDELVAYKAVRDDYRSQCGTAYHPGTTASCDDFTDTDTCGGGLHFSPTPTQARDYDQNATRYIELRIPVASVRTITGGGAPKAKAAAVECVREVDIHGRPIGADQ